MSIVIRIFFCFLFLFFIWVFFKLFHSPGVGKLRCKDGYCATSLITGNKRCGTGVIYDPAFETCNPPFSCEHPTPYAVKLDGSTDDTGVCPKDTICRCLRKPRCNPMTVTVFERVEDFYRQRDDLNENSQCYISPYVLNRLVPRTSECSFGRSPTNEELLNCIKSNPCNRGTLAFFEDTGVVSCFENLGKEPCDGVYRLIANRLVCSTDFLSQ
ncbi:MAG: hypothetical protein KatS3mg101_0797 [Patescibacteria group bacterium]|nr:MAG: hypothetical protein KatS3mg101_0797 [Patescibacteria group bacterium]